MKPGDILLFKGEDGFAKLISWGTDSEYSHVALCVSPEMNLAIEAYPGRGVRARDIRQIKTEYDVYRVKPIYNYNLNGVISYLVACLNRDYDWWGVAYLGFLKLLSKARILPKTAPNSWQKDNDYFCSELCYLAFYNGGGLDIVPQVSHAEITSPGDIAKSDRTERVI